MLDFSTLPTDPNVIRQQLYDRMRTQDFVDFGDNTHTPQSWDSIIETVFGHFCGLYAMYLWENDTTVDRNKVGYGDFFREIFGYYGHPNYRRIKFPSHYAKMGLGLVSFIKSMADELTDIDQEVYDWYPASISDGWNAALGNPKTYPGVTLVYGKTSAPNQTRAYGPYLNYVYDAGRKNAVSQNILILDDKTAIFDYAKYKGAPGFRSAPYPTQQSYQATTQRRQKMSYNDWKQTPYNSNPRYIWRSIQPLTGRTASDPMFYSYRGSIQTKRLNQPIPTLNYHNRYLAFL